MSGLELDFDALRSARRRVRDAIATFDAADRVGDEVAAHTGHGRLASKVRDFASNWDYNRAQLAQSLAVISDALDAIIQTMSDVDAALVDSLETTGDHSGSEDTQ